MWSALVGAEGEGADIIVWGDIETADKPEKYIDEFDFDTPLEAWINVAYRLDLLLALVLAERARVAKIVDFGLKEAETAG